MTIIGMNIVRWLQFQMAHGRESMAFRQERVRALLRWSETGGSRDIDRHQISHVAVDHWGGTIFSSYLGG